MLTAEQTEAFSRDGFVAGPVVLSAAEVDELREEIGLDRPSTFKGHPVEISLRPVKRGRFITITPSHGMPLTATTATGRAAPSPFTT